VAVIKPFAGVHFARRADLDLSALIAPPYDVLDEAGKASLQARHPNNIVTVDLPFLPPKSVGPDEVYAKANTTLQSWLSSGIMVQDVRAALYPYAQSYDHAGRTFHRRGFITLVKLTPFGVDVIPHEKTYKGPIEDRMKLMHATGMQLSPIFGLFSDPRNEVTGALYKNLVKPEFSATMDNVKNDMWSVIDADTENHVIDLMRGKHVYIADGHHRYTTALGYQAEMIRQNGGKELPPSHPANYCMFVLVGMQDPGLQILPTHRLLGNIPSFDISKLSAALNGQATVTESDLDVTDLLRTAPPHAFGLFDGRTRKRYVIQLTNVDVLEKLEPSQSVAWRHLDVALLQRYLLDEIFQPTFVASGQELSKGYTAYAEEIPKKVDGSTYQVALMLQSTPLAALEELGRHGEVMPQKSTYFFPKLATGMVLNPLR